MAFLMRRSARWPQAWPPPGATELDTELFYEQLAGEGFAAYGPAFRGLCRAWRHGDGLVLAEAELPEAGRGLAGSFGIHPALLDAALHGMVFAGLEAAGAGGLPSGFTGMVLHASGASRLRVALTRTGPDQVAVAAADGAGVPVLSAGSVAIRPAAVGSLAGGLGDGAMLAMQWAETGTGVPAVPVRQWAAGRPGAAGRAGAGYAGLAEVGAALDGGAAVPQAVLLAVSGDPDPGAVVASVHELAGWVLGQLRYWLAMRTGSPGSRWLCRPRVPSPPDPGELGWTTLKPARRCGAWSGRRRPRTPAGSFCSTPTPTPAPARTVAQAAAGGPSWMRWPCWGGCWRRVSRSWCCAGVCCARPGWSGSALPGNRRCCQGWSRMREWAGARWW